MPAEARFTVIVLAAQRNGKIDPLAERAGVSHKCLVPTAGKPLLTHVLDALNEVEAIGEIRIVIEPTAVAEVEPLTQEAGAPIRFVPAADNLADSVHAGAGDLEGPFVVTTADNVLLTPGAVRQVAERLWAGDDAVVALARREDVLAAHPEAQRRFYMLSDDGYSNCNLYGLSRRGVATAEAFRGGGQFASKPMRVARAFGLVNLLILRFGLVGLDGAMRRLSRRFGVRFSAVLLDDGAHAVDVDNARTYAIAAQLLERRAASS